MTPTPLTCPRCGREIRPGDMVTIIGPDPDARILLEDDALVVHETCPQGDGEPGGFYGGGEER